MKYYFKSFLYLIFLDVILMPLGSILGQSGLGNIFFHFFKIPFIGLFIVTILFHFKFKVRLNYISILFLVFGFISFFVGLFTNDIGKPFFTHVYGFLLPVLGMSLGSYFYQYSDSKDIFLFHKVFKWSFIGLAFLTIIYFLLYLAGVITYFGMATRWPYFAAYALSNNKMLMFLVCVLLVIMTGKRSMVAQYIVFFTLFLFQNKKRYSFALSRKAKFALLILVTFGIFIGLKEDIFFRFQPLFDVVLQDKYSLYIATSGRSAEVFGVLDHLNSDNIMWLFGGGFGETFQYVGGLGKETYTLTNHYSHFSPLYFVLVYGGIFTVLFYLALVYTFGKNFHKGIDIFYLLAIGGFVSSFMSSIMLIDLQFWFYLGGCIYSSKNRKYFGKFNLILKKEVACLVVKKY